MALPLTDMLLPAAVPLVAPFVVLQPTEVYPVFGVIVGVVIAHVVALFFIVQLPLVLPIALTLDPLLKVTVMALLVIA